MIDYDDFNISSDKRILHHFTGLRDPLDHEANLNTLFLILESEVVIASESDLRNNGWGTTSYSIHLNDDKSLVDESLIRPKISCFTDIQPDLIDAHTKTYGYFGLSFPRHSLIKHGARPVIYIPTRQDDYFGVSGRAMLNDLDSIVRSYHPHTQEDGSHPRTMGRVVDDEKKAFKALASAFESHFLCYLKPFNSELSDNDDQYFLKEQEWRRLGNFKFKRNRDVMQIFVADGYAECVIKRYPQFHDRIVSLKAHQDNNDMGK